MPAARGSDPEAPWLFLIHQLPPRPAYLRVKTARRLLRTGAVAVKNTVYVLPRSDQSREDFQWLVQEIVRGGGEALVCETRLVEGLKADLVHAVRAFGRTPGFTAAATENARRINMPVE